MSRTLDQQITRVRELLDEWRSVLRDEPANEQERRRAWSVLDKEFEVLRQLELTGSRVSGRGPDPWDEPTDH